MANLLFSDHLMDFEWVISNGGVYNTYQTKSNDTNAIWQEIGNHITQHHPNLEVVPTTITPIYACPQTAEIYFRPKINVPEFPFLLDRVEQVLSDVGFSFPNVIEDILEPCEGTDNLDMLLPMLDTIGWKMGGDTLDLHLFTTPLVKERRLEYLCYSTGNDYLTMKNNLESMFSLNISDILRTKIAGFGIEYLRKREIKPVLKVYYYLGNLKESDKDILRSSYGMEPDFSVTEERFDVGVWWSLLGINYIQNEISKLKYYYRLGSVELVSS